MPTNLKCTHCGSKANLHTYGSSVMCRQCALNHNWRTCYCCGILVPYGCLKLIGDYGPGYCPTCIADGCSACTICSNLTPNENLIQFNGELHCESCHADMDFDRDTEHVCDSYVKTNSSRHYGIEIETDYCPGYLHFYDDPRWGAKFDDTITGKEFYSSKFKGDCGLKAVEDLCEFAKGHAWGVDENCGLHIHMDMSKESCVNLRAVAYAYNNTMRVWETLVHKDRINNTWCEHMQHDGIKYLKTKRDWRTYSYDSERYSWVNLAAYSVHGTFEIRSHEGALDAVAICNWIRAHLIFVDWAIETGCVQVNNLLQGDTYELFHRLCEIWTAAGAPDLATYYTAKTHLRLPQHA